MDKDERLFRIIKAYRDELQKKIREREVEMESDNNDHYVLYNALGFTSEEGYQIDYQQNVGRLGMSIYRPQWCIWISQMTKKLLH